MVQVKPKVGEKKKTTVAILDSLNYLFYVSKFFGVVPYSLTDYITKKRLKLSLIGCIWCLFCCVHFIGHHYAITSMTILYQDSQKSIGMLTYVIGLLVVYLSPVMMAIDIFASLFNQKVFITVFDRLMDLDEKLMRENISINFKVITKYSIIFLVINFVTEFFLTILNLFVFDEEISWYSIWFLTTAIPHCVNGIARIWFLILILLVQQRLRSINAYLEDAKNFFQEKKNKRVNNPNYVDLKKDNIFIENVGFLEKEIFTTKNLTFKNLLVGGNEAKWVVEQSTKGNNFGDISHLRPTNQKFIKVMPHDANNAFDMKSIINNNKNNLVNGHESIIGDNLDRKLISLCRAHDEICDIAKQINKMFSFQMLITMAYGFLNITAQLYFLYCGLIEKGSIPIFFRSAESIVITIFFIAFVSFKCVCVVYISWKTKIDSQKTGIQLHKISNVVDENHFYNVCNHLSLKLLNHHLNFTACGFFGLEMSTIYAITGAITSYLIILIQFNLAAIRAKPTITSNVTETTTETFLNITNIATIMPPIVETVRP